MKLFKLLFLVAVISACSTTEQPKHKNYTIEQFYKNISVNGGRFSADATKLLVNSNESGIYNVYEIDIESGNKTMLTNSTEESYFGSSYFPNDNRFIFSFDKGGNENSQLHMMSEDGKATALLPGDTMRNGFWGWSKDEKTMFISSNKRDPKFMDMYEMSLASVDDGKPQLELLYQNNDGLNVEAISPNRNYFALTRTITNADAKMYLYDRSSGKMEDISIHEGDATYSPQFFSLDNNQLFYITDEGADFAYLAMLDIETGLGETVYVDEWDVRYAYQSRTEKYRVIGINADAKTVVKIFKNQSGEEVILPEIEGGSISSVSISKSEELARLTVSTSASPSNIYVYNFATKELKKLTNTLNSEIDAADLVEGKVIRYPSFDGVQIPAIYYQPKNASVKNKVPGLVWVHGGPGGQSRLSYFPLIQYLTNHGYAVLAVNNRGSSGYGKKFNHMDDKNHGDKDLKDCIAAKDFFATTGIVDMDKIGIIGGSYGGYMTMAALTFTPEEFAVGVNIFGVTNWLRTLKSIPPYWESFRKSLYDELGDPGTADSVRLYEISPIFHTQNVTKPLMVMQGANDVRVLQVESDEIVEGVRANGIPVEYVIFDDEGHGFRKKENEIDGYGKVKVFLDKYLKGEGDK